MFIMLMELKLSLKYFMMKLETIESDTSNLKESELEILKLKNTIINLEVFFPSLLFSNNEIFCVEVM